MTAVKVAPEVVDDQRMSSAQADEPRGNHRTLLISLASGLLACGAVLWILGYLEQGARGGDRFNDLGAGILTGAVVSLAFWFIDRAGEEREARRHDQAEQHHAELMAGLRRLERRSDGPPIPTETSLPSTRADP